MRLSRKGLLCAVTAMLCWAMSFIWIKVVYRYYHPITMVFLRLTVATILLTLISYVGGKGEKIAGKDLKRFMALAFFEPFLYFLGESFGMELVSPTLAAVIVSTIPVFTPFAARLFLKEPFSPTNLLGLMLSFGGILLMVLNRDLSLAASPTGILLMFFAVAAAIGYSMLIGDLSNRYNSFTIVKTQFTFGALYFLPLFLAFDLSHFLSVPPNFELVGNLLMLTIFSSILSFMLFIQVIREIGISRSNVFSNLIPVFTAILSFFILDEVFSSMKVAGIGVVVVGLFLSQIEISFFRKILPSKSRG